MNEDGETSREGKGLNLDIQVEREKWADWTR